LTVTPVELPLLSGSGRVSISPVASVIRMAWKARSVEYIGGLDWSAGTWAIA
jgi:hypothetical protein